MKTKLFLLVFVAALTASCASRPLVYEEMTEEERQDEVRLQENLENAASTIADAGFRFIDDEETQTKIADQVSDVLIKIIEVLRDDDAEKELIDQVLGAFNEINDNIREVAKDAFDLFAGWIDLPNLNDLLPEVITDRLLAFLRGALDGLSDYRSTTE